MTENLDDSANESILYEVLEYFVKKQDPEITKFKNDSVILPASGTIKNALRYLNNRYSLPESISTQLGFTLPWKFAIGDRGRILAILQENVIEIRKSKDEYSSVVGKASVPRDCFPQWRKLVWSPDGSTLALASSNGYISFYNAFGNNIFNISPKAVSQNPEVLEAGDAIASMFFKKPRVKSDKWDFEFIRVSYSGLLKSYCISGSEYDENHEFSFGNFYRHGVNSVTYSERHNLFFVAGNNVHQNFTCIASEIGLTCWRTLNDHPYYKLSVTSQDNDMSKTGFSIWQFIPIIKPKAQPIIFKASLSPNNQFLVCLHTDGTISIWSVPGLKLHKQWKLLEQPNHDIVNPLRTYKLKKSTANISDFQPIDVGWWSDNAVIIARYSGAVTVCSVDSLDNLLGNSPEFLYNHPQIDELGDVRGFLCLDCEVLVTGTKRNRESNNENQVSELSSDSERDDDESKPATILNYTTNLMQSALYSITDIEKFQPKRKKSKVFHRTYRLLGLKSTTPEELYSRKIEIEAYEEALSLAKTYNLDPDLVYQTQWRKSEFSINDIQEHLSKVSKRSWVLNECVSRVPESLEATRELLNFGLNGANLETLVAISIEDNGKFTPSDVDNDTELDENSSEFKQIQKVNQILENVTKDNLNESQKELIKFRKKLLSHLDKLQTYQIFLESPSNFDKKFYEEFRRLSPLENAIKFAKSCNFRGVEIMFTYYGAYLTPHWLTILSFFPETLNPDKYQKLLPECDMDGRLFLLYQQELRQKDWVERSIFSDVIEVEDDDTAEKIYENRSSLLAYRDKEYTQDLLKKWYIDRAYEIERDSRLVDHALTLVNIGKSHNINGLEKLLFELETLDDLVYKVGLEDLSLTEVEKLNDFEKINLLMKNSNENNFVENIKSMLLPYARRKKRYLDEKSDDDLLYEYLISLSRNDLALPAKFFESLKISYDLEILDATKSITTLAIDCIYECNDIDMYLKAKAIFDDTIIHSTGREDINEAYKELENELKSLQILNKYEVKIPLHYIRSSKKNTLDAKDLFMQISENFMDIYPVPAEKNWSQMLNDMLDIQEHTFKCLEVETCFEISMMARLKSRSKTSIQGCTNLMEFKKTGRSHLKVSYERAIDFILQASSDYFNNSKSLTDPDMELAKECLHLIPDDNERIKEEYDLIESLQILNEFHINILPLQVRTTQERIKLVEDCLNSKRDAYKNKQKLLNLSKYLRVERKNSRLREGKVLNLIAKKSYEMKDYNFCSTVIRQMMKMNYQAAWGIAMNIANCDEFSDLPFRTQCIWFAIHNGPSDMIESFMKRANLLKVQMLNSDLEKWMPLDNESLSEDNRDGETERQNPYSVPTTENKEFVPKIVQTSTDLVKTSAQIVKQSTFDLIKNAGNTDFWKSKLNFNFVESTPKEVKDDQIIEKKSKEPLQKFSSFYESLHENCDISCLDTRYSKYSQVDYNPQLKLCQTLLRISLLSENASYGIEVSDINHLLVQCAEHTISEDCIVGLSYLLNLDESYFMDVIDLFENLPQSELYHQILAYFCSIKLYTKIYPESHDVFMYDPLELIQNLSSVKIAETETDKKKLKQRINLLIQEIKPKSNEISEVGMKVEKIESLKTEKKSSTSNNIKKPLDYVQAPEEVDEWNSWGDDEWTDMPENLKPEEKLRLPAANNPLDDTEKDFNTDNQGEELTSTLNIIKSKEQKLSGSNPSLDAVRKDTAADDWDDKWTDMAGNNKHENEEKPLSLDDSLSVIQKNIDTDGWEDDWADMPENTKQEKEQQLSNTNDRLDIIDPDMDADGWDDGWNDVPVNIKHKDEEKSTFVETSLDVAEKETVADNWDDGWTETPVNDEEEGQESSDLHNSLNATEMDAIADNWSDKLTDMPENIENKEQTQPGQNNSTEVTVQEDGNTNNLADKSTDIRTDTIITREEENINLKETVESPGNEADGWDDEEPDILVDETLTNEKENINLKVTLESPGNKADGWDDEELDILVDETPTNEEENINLKETVESPGNEADGWDDEGPDMSVGETPTNEEGNINREETVESPGNEADGWDDEGPGMSVGETPTNEEGNINREEDLTSAEHKTDGWDDWPDVSVDKTTTNGIENTNLKETLEFIEQETNDWDDDWPDISLNNVTNETNEVIVSSKLPNIIETNMSTEKRREILIAEISKVQNVEDCVNVKRLLLHRPNVHDTEPDNTLDANLVIQLINKMVEINRVNKNFDDGLLQEIKNFLQEGLVSQEVFIEYLEREKHELTSEQLIYLQLCSNKLSVQQTAIGFIKNNYKMLTLNSVIFEEIFFCNLTSSFSVSHDLYYKILENVFENRTLPEIESNVRLLVGNLVEQKNIPHAIALQNQLEGIPPALSTYENCFQLLLKK